MIGTFDTYHDFDSRFLPPRRVDVWRPPQAGSRPRPVVYMHDGQNLFEPEHATHNITWGVVEAFSQLPDPPMVVGMWCHDNRWQEYLPQRPFEADHGIEALSAVDYSKIGGIPVSDRYLRFVVEEVKPFIDEHYPTLPDQPNTTIMGSSMGGLISLYALCEYPDVFGQAGCVSTHWPALDGVMLPYLSKALPSAGNHRIYFDYGTVDLDSHYEPYQIKVDPLMAERGYRQPHDWVTRKFPGANHSEAAWSQRLPDIATFLFPE